MEVYRNVRSKIDQDLESHYSLPKVFASSSVETKIFQSSVESFSASLGLSLLGVSLIVLLILISKLTSNYYKRPPKGMSLVRTGLGGQKVIVDKSEWVLPVLHDVTPVNMNTVRIEIYRGNEQSLITKDRLRANIQVDFYIRVNPTHETIGIAAQTLGEKTTDPAQLKDHLEGKFVSCLRTVVAGMVLSDLHDERAEFLKQVRESLEPNLSHNGLELESVSLTGLDQTGPEYFNPENAFDMEGLTKLTREIESRREERNAIEREAEFQIQAKNQELEIQLQEKILETECRKLNFQKDEESARLQQDLELSRLRAEATLEREKRQKEAECRKIEAEQELKLVTVESEKVLATEKIQKDSDVKELELQKQKLLAIQEIERRKEIDLSQQDFDIAIAEKSNIKAQAKIEAYQAQADVVQVEENLITVRERAQAERAKIVELIEATIKAEKEAIQLVTLAEAEKKASLDQVEAKRILAKGEADAEKMKAELKKLQYEIDAYGRRSLHEADNILSNAQISLQIKMALIKHLPEVIRESVKPMENIEGIKIYQVEGIGNAYSSGHISDDTTNVNRGGNLADEIVSSALRYRAQAPLIDSILNEIGLENQTLESLTQSVFQEDSIIRKPLVE